MPRLYCDANPRTIAYVLDGGGSGYQNLPTDRHTSMEAEYLAIIYGLNEYYLKWNRELDARFDNMTRESIKDARASGEDEFYNVASPSDKTKRPLPPPVLVCCDNEVVVKQLSRQFHIGNEKLRKLAQRVWQMTQNVEVKYMWIPRSENLAGKMLK